VHGDIKSENVLICTTKSGGVVAKLADFGCAIADLEPSDRVKLPAFTLPWNAPESHEHLPAADLQYTDIYSYGLLVWRVAVNGVNPFRLVPALASLDPAHMQRELEILKKQDRILPLVHTTLREPFCEPDVNTSLVWHILQQTLQLDPVKRCLRAPVASLSDGGVVPSYPARPLERYEVVDVSDHRVIG
jgi:serine/threonine protein kinase